MHEGYHTHIDLLVLLTSFDVAFGFVRRRIAVTYTCTLSCHVSGLQSGLALWRKGINLEKKTMLCDSKHVSNEKFFLFFTFYVKAQRDLHRKPTHVRIM